MKFNPFVEPDFDALSHCAICVTGAIIGGVAAAGSVASAAIGGSAAKSAARTQAKAAEKAQEISQEQYAQTRSDLAPYREVGTAALPGYESLLGIGPGGMSGITSALANVPGYQFTKTQGLQAVQSAMSAQGLGASGPMMKGVTQYAEGLAGTTYQSILGNYYNALGVGENSSAQTGQFGLAAAGQQEQAVTAAGAAQASGIVGAANATIGGINTAIGGITNALLLPSIFGETKGMYGGAGNAFPAAPGSTVGSNLLV